MALTSKPSSSASPLGETPCKIKVQLMRMWKEGRKKKAGNSIEVVLLESSGTRIHTRIDETFSKWIMDISDEKMDDDIDIPKALLAIECPDPIKTIVREVYGDSFADPDFCHDRAILCHSDANVDLINDYMLSLLPGEEKFCYSDDCLPPRDEYESSPSDYLLVAPTVFGSCILPGLPLQILRLKVGAPVMLLTDIDPSRGLWTGTRLQITKLGDSMLEARFAACNNYGERVEKFLIPKTHMYPPKSFRGTVRRTQFPLTLAFAMTINKSQGQTFSKVGLYLPRRVLPHGQRYVAISKVKARTGFKVLITGEDGKPHKEADNVVFEELFQYDVVFQTI